MRRNRPFTAQQPAPLFANDESGYWSTIAQNNAASGLQSVLPSGTLFQSDTAVKSRLLSSQIEWTPTKARFKGSDIIVSLSDAQFFMALEEGGDTQQGRLTIIVNKFEFRMGFPSYEDTLEIYAAGKWHELTVAELIGQHDDNEPALTLYLEKDQNDNGD